MKADSEVSASGIKIKIIFGKMHDALMHPISKVVGGGGNGTIWKAKRICTPDQSIW